MAALAKLRRDLDAGLNHLLMARCSSIARATFVERLYQQLAPELRPILIHSKISDTEARLADLRSGTSRVVICVDMLGEGLICLSSKWLRSMTVIEVWRSCCSSLGGSPPCGGE